MWSVIQSKAFQNSLFSWLLTIFTTKGHYIIENMLLHCCLIRAGGKIFLGLTLVLLHLNYLLLVSLSWKSVEAWFVSRWSLKDLIKVTFTISFSFWKKLRKVNAGIMAVCRKKNWNCVGFVEWILPKNINYMGKCYLVTIKKVFCWARRVIYLFLNQRWTS